MDAGVETAIKLQNTFKIQNYDEKYDDHVDIVFNTWNFIDIDHKANEINFIWKHASK